MRQAAVRNVIPAIIISSLNFNGLGCMPKEPKLGYLVFSMVNNRFSKEMGNGTKIPHTAVRYAVWSIEHDVPKVSIVFWLRCHTDRELTDAIATLHMMHDYPIILVRAFVPHE